MNLLKLSSVIDSVRLIPLETNDAALLSGISKIDLDSGIYFIQNTNDKIIYAFDVNGDYKYKIGEIGNGPYEMQKPECFALDKEEGRIFISDNFRSMMEYDYNGNFIEKQPLNLFYKNFIIYDKTKYFHASKLINYKENTGDYLCWNLWSKDQYDTFHTFFKYEYEIYPNGSKYFETKTPFSFSNSTYFYHFVFSDIIYSINNQELTPRYHVCFGDKAEDLSVISGEEAFSYLTSDRDNGAYLHNVLVMDDFIKFQYILGNKVHHVFYSKTEKKVVEGFLQNDILGSNIDFIFSDGNKLIGVLDPSNIIVDEQTELFFEGSVIKKLKEIKSDDNFLLLECSIKSLSVDL